jgi:hypothetical protein
MTALQVIIKEAKAIRKKSPKMEWKKAVAQASAIYASKHKGKSPVGKKHAVKKKVAKKKVAKKKLIGKTDKKLQKGLASKGLKMPHGYDVVKRVRKVGAVKKSATTMHKDTKSHNVNIRVMSGISNKAMEDLKKTVQQIRTIENEILNHKLTIKQTKELWAKNLLKQNIVKLKKMLQEYKDHARELKKHI